MSKQLNINPCSIFLFKQVMSPKPLEEGQKSKEKSADQGNCYNCHSESGSSGGRKGKAIKCLADLG
jgi:hypothetical protein